MHENKRHPELRHDTEAHAEMIELSKNPTSTCCILGFSLLALKKVGEELSVDRPDPAKGYVEGNMVLMTASLNTAKGPRQEVPKRSINRVLRKLYRVRGDRWSKTDAEVIRD